MDKSVPILKDVVVERFKDIEAFPYEAPIGNLFIAVKKSLWDDLIAGKPDGNAVGFIFTRFLMCGEEKGMSRFIEICFTKDMMKDVVEIVRYFKEFVFLNGSGCLCGYGSGGFYVELIGNNDDVIVINEKGKYRLFKDIVDFREYLIKK